MVYNGRTSSLVISGTPIARPYGIVPSSPSNPKSQPVFRQTQALDFELEMGVFISKPLERGQRLDIADAKEHIFGLVLLNDWSSRDIQMFEMQPLGPFHGKGSGTTISPWIVTMEALTEAEAARHMLQLPAPLPHLEWIGKESEATFDIEVSAKIIRTWFAFSVPFPICNFSKPWRHIYLLM
jgi:fumarylacetoacetase